jgi:FKBP-type peptidyl-prolyl cis-trans isomerase SlyD
MKVAKNTVVTLAYSVTDPDNDVLDSGDAPIIYLHGGYDGIFPKIEEALEGKTVGHTITISLEPDEAFGDYDADLLRIVDLEDLPDGIEVGMQIEETVADDGVDDEDEFILFTVTDIAENKAVLDGNHPLSGIRLKFSCTITGIRPASPDEITAGIAESLSVDIGTKSGHA